MTIHKPNEGSPVGMKCEMMTADGGEGAGAWARLPCWKKALVIWLIFDLFASLIIAIAIVAS